MQKWHDLTQKLGPDLKVYPGDPQFRVIHMRDEHYQLSEICLGSHSGTHVDAPAHFNYSTTIDEMPLELMTGLCRLVSLSDLDTLMSLPVNGERLLIRTDSTSEDRWKGINIDQAQRLLDGGVRLVGIDTPGIEDFADENFPVHHLLLGAGVWIVENLVLTDLDPGEYELLILPLPLEGLDAAPARVLLRSLR